MSKETKHTAEALQWKWVIIGALVGLVIVGASYYITKETFHNIQIQILVMLVGCAVTGIVVGYFSPGVTIKEAAIAGVVVVLIMTGFLYYVDADVAKNIAINALLIILGLPISWVGGWAGENLQGSEVNLDEELKADKIQWKWVITAIIVGFVLNVLFVFLPSKLFSIDLQIELVAFLVSFVIAGFIVGYKSPGVTIKEPAIAGIIAVVFEWIFLEFILKISIAVPYLIAGLALGFLFTLIGAWVGEKYQESTGKRITV
ncbi:MAG TPA: hypothetical protein VI758_10695 [Bacteroidota bacterium]